MTWIKTSSIEVPAHANQTTEVAINEWFNNNRSFLLGTPVANQLRGTAGGWAQTMAVAPIKDQDTIGLLRDRLSQILKMAKGDGDTSPSPSINEFSNKPSYSEGNTMATVIPVDKFESNSFYAFILRENPKASGIEIHFPQDCADSEALERRWTNSERMNLRDRINTGTNGLVSLIEKEGFDQAHKNPFLWYTKETDSSSFDRKITKARGWVNKCAGRGAYEIPTDVPVESTRSRRRGASKLPAPTQPDSPTPPPVQPAQGNKLADAIAAVLLPQIVETIGSTISADEARQLRAENRHLEELVAGMKGNLEDSDAKNREANSLIEQLKEELYQLQQTRTQWEVENNALANERDTALAKIQEMEQAMSTLGEEVKKFRGMAMELERDRDSLKLTLSELGLDEPSPTPSAQEAVSWDDGDASGSVSEPMSWDEEDEPAAESPDQSMNWDEEVTELGEPSSGSSSESEPGDTEESEGFDLDSLGEL